MTQLLLPVLFFITGALVLLWPRRAQLITLVAVLSSGVLVVMLAARFFDYGPISYTIGGWPAKMGIELYFDEIGLYFSALAVVLGLAVITYLWNRRMKSHFYLLFNFLFGSIYTLIFAYDLFNIFVAMEFLTLISFLLIGYPRRPYQIWAGLKYLLLSAIGMGMYLLGVAVLYYHTGALNLGIIAELVGGELTSGRMTCGLAPQYEAWVIVSSALLVTGLAVRAGIFLFSMWLPDAYSFSSPVVAALLAGLSTKMAGIILIRLAAVFPIDSVLLILGCITGILGGLYAIFSHELRRIISFSALAQVGYLLIGLGVGREAGITGGMLHLVAHGLIISLLFLAGGTAIAAVGGGSVSLLNAKRAVIPPLARLSLLIGLLALGGFPWLPPFVGRALLSGGIESGWLKAVVSLISLTGVIAIVRLLPVGYISDRNSPFFSRDSLPESLSFVVLLLPILFFFPLVRLAGIEINLGDNLIKPSMILISGILLWHLVIKERITGTLPKGILKLDWAIISLVAGFSIIYLLIGLL
ncbi:hypothetical protein LR021_02335 [Candidatus Bipolaricaulota bacterium]|nr:hypothetical protein [Candidatus Bipolaricaulota bacterium]HBR10177.1 hypothetical protein [Candidatus Acetothermia bacterium]